MPPKTGRVMKEFKDVGAKNYDGVTISFFDDSDPFNWKMVIDGQDAFKGGKFIVALNFSEYPFKPPAIEFKTKVYHPNVANDGKICTQAIDSNWVPTKSACDVIDFVLTTFRHPTAENAQDMDIANVWSNKKSQWEATAAEWVQLYAK